jgi:hypothetical protein
MQKQLIELIKEKGSLSELTRIIAEHPDLINASFTQESGSNGKFTPLILAIEHANTEASRLLITEGADLHFRTPGTKQYDAHKDKDVLVGQSVAFHFLLKRMIKLANLPSMALFMLGRSQDDPNSLSLFDQYHSIWDFMNENNLQYTNNSSTPFGTSLNTAIDQISSAYGKKHCLANRIDDEFTYELSDRNRNPEKEIIYTEILSKIIHNMSIEEIQHTDASSLRDNFTFQEVDFFNRNGFVDCFALWRANELVQEKFGCDLPNYRGEDAFLKLDNEFSYFATIEEEEEEF